MTIFSSVKNLAVTKYTLNHWCNRMGHRQKKGAKGANSDKVKGKRGKKAYDKRNKPAKRDELDTAVDFFKQIPKETKGDKQTSR